MTDRLEDGSCSSVRARKERSSDDSEIEQSEPLLNNFKPRVDPKTLWLVFSQINQHVVQNHWLSGFGLSSKPFSSPDSPPGDVERLVQRQIELVQQCSEADLESDEKCFRYWLDNMEKSHLEDSIPDGIVRWVLHWSRQAPDLFSRNLQEVIWSKNQNETPSDDPIIFGFDEQYTRYGPISAHHRQVNFAKLKDTCEALVSIQSKLPRGIPGPPEDLLKDVFETYENGCYDFAIYNGGRDKYEELMQTEIAKLASMQTQAEPYLRWLHKDLEFDVFHAIECAATADARASTGEVVEVRDGATKGCTGALVNVYNRASATKGPEALIILHISGRQCRYDLHDLKWSKKEGPLNVLRNPEEIQVILDGVDQPISIPKRVRTVVPEQISTGLQTIPSGHNQGSAPRKRSFPKAEDSDSQVMLPKNNGMTKSKSLELSTDDVEMEGMADIVTTYNTSSGSNTPFGHDAKSTSNMTLANSEPMQSSPLPPISDVVRAAAVPLVEVSTINITPAVSDSSIDEFQNSTDVNMVDSQVQDFFGTVMEAEAHKPAISEKNDLFPSASSTAALILKTSEPSSKSFPRLVDISSGAPINVRSRDETAFSIPETDTTIQSIPSGSIFSFSNSTNAPDQPAVTSIPTYLTSAVSPLKPAAGPSLLADDDPFGKFRNINMGLFPSISKKSINATHEVQPVAPVPTVLPEAPELPTTTGTFPDEGIKLEDRTNIRLKGPIDPITTQQEPPTDTTGENFDKPLPCDLTLSQDNHLTTTKPESTPAANIEAAVGQVSQVSLSSDTTPSQAETLAAMDIDKSSASKIEVAIDQTSQVSAGGVADDGLQSSADIPNGKAISPQANGSTTIAVDHSVSTGMTPHAAEPTVDEKRPLRKNGNPGAFEVLHTLQSGHQIVMLHAKNGYKRSFMVPPPTVRLPTLEETLARVAAEAQEDEAKRRREERYSMRMELRAENRRARRSPVLQERSFSTLPVSSPQCEEMSQPLERSNEDLKSAPAPELEIPANGTDAANTHSYLSSDAPRSPISHGDFTSHFENGSAYIKSPTQIAPSNAVPPQASEASNDSVEEPSWTEALHLDPTLDEIPDTLQQENISLAVMLWAAIKWCQGAWKSAHPWLNWIFFSLVVPFILVVIPAICSALYHIGTVMVPRSAKSCIKSLEYLNIYVEFPGDRKVISNNELALQIGRSVWGQRDRDSILRGLEELSALKENLSHVFPNFKEYFDEHEYKDLDKLRMISDLLAGTITFSHQISGPLRNTVAVLREELLQLSTSNSTDEKAFSKLIYQALGMQVFFKQYADVKISLDQHAALHNIPQYFKALEDLHKHWLTFVRLGISDRIQAHLRADSTIQEAWKHVSHRGGAVLGPRSASRSPPLMRGR